MNKYKGVKSVLSISTKVVETDICINSGYKMPLLGFGTYTIKGKDNVHRALDAALKAGYRSIDTATAYDNETEIGESLKELLPRYKLKREDLFITSKLHPRDQGKDKTRDSVLLSLKNLQVDYLDLYLIHWPGAANLPDDSKDHSRLRYESYEELLQLKKEGKLRSVGVSNYLARHLKELIEKSTTAPAVNQVELHPHWKQDDSLYEVCEEYQILIQAYSSLGGNRSKNLISDPCVVAIAEKLKKQPAQVLLRWGLQIGAGIIPKSATPERIEANAQLDFVLSEEDMTSLNSIGNVHKYSWNPQVIP